MNNAKALPNIRINLVFVVSRRFLRKFIPNRAHEGCLLNILKYKILYHAYPQADRCY